MAIIPMIISRFSPERWLRVVAGDDFLLFRFGAANVAFQY